MKNALEDLIGLEIKLAEFVRELSPKILAASRPEVEHAPPYDHYNFKLPCFLLAHLVQLDHPANTLKGQEWCADLAVGLVDGWVEPWHARYKASGDTNTSEWPIYAVLEVMRFLGDKVTPAKRERWVEFIENYLQFAMRRPFGHTAPNHEAWRALDLYWSGVQLNNPEWTDAGLFFARRLLGYQTAEGFWEEGRHHGPSMRYNNVMLAGLSLIARHSGEEDIRVAAVRLAEFMSTWMFPNGMTVGAFDGRQSTSVGYYAPVVPGFEWCASGRAVNARAVAMWRKTGRTDNVMKFSNSLWYAMFSSMFYGVACHYYTQVIPASERDAAIDENGNLPVDADGTIHHQSENFDALLHRSSKWTLALSSQNSDVPIQQRSIYRLDRQSRVELVHKDASLVLGGGHNRNDWAVPYANVIVDTGYAGVTDFGHVDAKANQARLRYFIPRRVRSYVDHGKPLLEWVFGHANIRMAFDLEENEQCGIEVKWDVRFVERLTVMLPLVVWNGAVCSTNGKPIDNAAETPVAAGADVTVKGGVHGSTVKLTAPQGVETKVRYPMPILGTYLDSLVGEESEEMSTPFELALVICQWTNPPKQGQAEFSLDIK